MIINKKDIVNIFFLTVFFSFLVAFIVELFFPYTESSSYIEEEYTEKTNMEISDDIYEIKTEIQLETIKEEESSSSIEAKEDIEKNVEIEEIELSASKEYSIKYIPEGFESGANNYLKSMSAKVLDSSDFYEFIRGVVVALYEERVDVRGKMKNATVHMFGINSFTSSEYLGVYIHELAHYVDLYFFSSKLIVDVSNEFYNISWESTKVIRAGEEQKDFVSGYAMSNKYEDFAESFAYFVLHNNDFLSKTKNSDSLKKKYEFFNKNLFDSRFDETNFGTEEIEDYYWDITKIKVNDENFLQFLKK